MHNPSFHPSILIRLLIHLLIVCPCLHLPRRPRILQLLLRLARKLARAGNQLEALFALLLALAEQRQALAVPREARLQVGDFSGPAAVAPGSAGRSRIGSGGRSRREVGRWGRGVRVALGVAVAALLGLRSRLFVAEAAGWSLLDLKLATAGVSVVEVAWLSVLGLRRGVWKATR